MKPTWECYCETDDATALWYVQATTYQEAEKWFKKKIELEIDADTGLPYNTRMWEIVKFKDEHGNRIPDTFGDKIPRLADRR